jgi:metallo-beta-lactamase class B
LQQGSGAQVAASAIGARVLRDGVIGKDDAQYDPAEDPRVPKVARVKQVGEGERLSVGKLRITAHMTPGHAPGGTTWSWTSCEKGRCLDMVYVDSLTAVSSDAFRFSDDPKRVAQFRETINKVGALKCDIVVSTHPGFTDIMQKHAQRKPGSNGFIDPAGCRNYARSSMERLEQRLATEAAPAAPAAR